MSATEGITIELVPSATEDIRRMVAELDQILSAEYPPEQRHGLALEAIFRPGIRFFLARLDGAAGDLQPAGDLHQPDARLVPEKPDQAGVKLVHRTGHIV